MKLLIALLMSLGLSAQAGLFAPGGAASAVAAAQSVTNNQMIATSGTYYVPYGVSVWLNLTNGGNVTILGNGIITSNWLSSGATETINCDQYCPNFGWTAFNYYTNQWQSVTCNIASRYVMFAQAPHVTGNAFYQYTTNQSDVFNINASERFDLVELEVTLDGGGTNHSAAYMNCIPPLIHWTTPYFFTGFCGTNANGVSYARTLNCVNGSSISCGIWDAGAPANDNNIFQMWTDRNGTNAYLTFNCAEHISSVPSVYGALQGGWQWLIYQTTNNSTGLGSTTNGGMILPTPVYVASNTVTANFLDVDMIDPNSGLLLNANIIGTIYDSWPNGGAGSNFGIQTNRLNEVSKAYPCPSGWSYFPVYWSGHEYFGQQIAKYTTTNGVLTTTNTSYIAGTSGLAKLSNGTNIVLSSSFNSNNLPHLDSYLSSDGTYANVYMKPSEWVQGVSFTIRSSNSSDTNQVGWWIKP